jgi:tetratricopeptide (TPR) repeat protein
MSSRSLRAFFLAMLLFLGASPLFADYTPAETLLRQGRVDEAGNVLRQAMATKAADARTHLLLCRVYYSQDKADEAVRECEMAAAMDPSNSDFQMWLGRAYGLKASQANMLSAFSIAKKVHNAFERAVQLDPTNAAAMSDLGQFYVQAPAIVGGGLDRAQALAPKLLTLAPAKGHRLLGLIADKKNDAAGAEREFKSAVAVAHAPDAWVDLAEFYQRRGQADKAYAALQASIEVNHAKDASLVDVAGLLTTLNRSLDVAERILRDYLASGTKSDDAPAFKVHVQLGELLKKRGDSAGARREFEAALALASNYVPARKALQSV